MSTATKKPAHRSPVREVCETAVFVVALVLMLKLFAVEAFVIPTGSMAETLYGWQKTVHCPECQHTFPVNSSSEEAPWDGVPRPVTEAVCPNCRHRIRFDPVRNPAPRNGSGDRVLVHKAMYHVDGGPTRGDVVVFKYPVDPQLRHEAQNYIKRLWGLGGETLALYRGDLYMTRALTYPADEADAVGTRLYPRPDDPRKLWEGPAVQSNHAIRPPYLTQGNDFTYHNADAATAAFAASRQAGMAAGPAEAGFQPLRKTDAQALAMRRLVYDNDHQSAALVRRGVPPRWQADGPGWSAADGKTFAHAGGLSFLRYRHRVPAATTGWETPDDPFPPAAITNFLGYNAGVEEYKRGIDEYWVGDLMLEARVSGAAADARVVLEVSRGLHRFRAEFAGGEVAISRSGAELARRPAALTGTHDLRFANVDGRLRVWVDGRAVDFGDAADHPPTDAHAAEPVAGALAGGAFAVRADGHTLQNDILAPASVGASGSATVQSVRLWQDTYFTPAGNRPSETPDDPVDTFYVQPGHYLCLGDNSGQSSDGRKWGLVPERLMLGKACVVFFPLDRIGFIR